GGGDRANVLRSEALRRWIVERLAAHARAHPSGSTSVARAVLLEEPASLDHGEITDKGSVNQRAVLGRRAAIVEAFYADEPGADVLIIR
ncbi:MAG: feruloyl-CoA synthase, partial [Gammaproteobacteria bacterium]|nr:feruloyl-CoA synthase [Gammaproteobacteria bacterium]